MDEDRGAVPRQDDVGRAGEAAAAQAEPVIHAMQQGTDHEFRLCLASPDAGHEGGKGQPELKNVILGKARWPPSQQEAKSACPMQISDMLPPLLRMAIKASSLETVKSMLEQGLDPNFQDAAGNTLLQYASKAGQIQICELLIAHGANLEQKPDDGFSPVENGNSYDVSNQPKLTPQPNLLIRAAEEFCEESDEWIAEEAVSLPRSDCHIAALASARQTRLSDWNAIDHDDAWEEVEISLPNPVRLGWVENPVVKAIVSLANMSDECGVIDPKVISDVISPLLDEENGVDEMLVKVECILASRGIAIEECLCDGYSWGGEDLLVSRIDDEFLEFTRAVLSSKFSSKNLFLGLLSKVHPVSKDEEIGLFQQLSEDPDNQVVRNRIIMSNLRFAYKIGATFSKDSRGVGVEDRVSEAVFGLIKSIDRFDVCLDFRFITYAVHWIRQRVQRCVQYDERNIRIPPNKLLALSRFRKVLDRVGGDIESALRIEEFKDQSSELIKLLGVAEEVSLEALFDGVGEYRVDLPFDFDGMLVVDQDLEIEEKELNSIIGKILGEVLTERESAVVRMYFGINCEKECTYDEIGRQMNVTRERVRQINNKALGKLCRSNAFRDLQRTYFLGE